MNNEDCSPRRGEISVTPYKRSAMWGWAMSAWAPASRRDATSAAVELSKEGALHQEIPSLRCARFGMNNEQCTIP